MFDLNKLKKFAAKSYRDGFLQTQVRSRISYQVQALRRKLQLTQAEFADKTGKKQSVVSRLESKEYGRVSVQTLLDIACGLDVALVVEFVSYPDFLTRSLDMSDQALQVDTIQESLAERRARPVSTSLSEILAKASSLNAPLNEGAPSMWTLRLPERSNPLIQYKPQPEQPPLLQPMHQSGMN